MIKDNIKGLFYHMVLMLISMLFLMIIAVISPYIGKYMIHPAGRIILGIPWIIAYIVIGLKMNGRIKRKSNFNSGMLIALIGLVLWGYSMYQTGLHWTPDSDVIMDYYYAPLNIYMGPILNMGILFDIEINQYIRLISCFIPTFLMGIGIRIKRQSLRKRRKRVLSDS